MEGCIFCKVIKKEVPGHFVVEEEDVVAFLDIFGMADGHVLVVPKKHGRSIQDFNKEELGEIMDLVRKVSIKMEKALDADSITIGINHKEEKGVPHLHIHLIPRYADDGGKAIQGVVDNGLESDLEEIASMLKAA